MKINVVVKVSVHDEKEKQKAMKAVSGLSGIESLALDMKEKKLTITGDIDPVDVVAKLRKNWYTEIVSVGVPEKKDDPKTDESKKEDAKKDDDDKKKKAEEEEIAELIKATKNYYQYPCMPQPCYYVQPQPENPNTCVIC